MNHRWGQSPDTIKPEEGHFLGRVIYRNRNKYKIGYENEIILAEVTGKMIHNIQEAAELPVTGDWVVFRKADQMGIIESLVPRTSVISRKVAGQTTEEQPIASNIHYIFIVMGLDGGRNYNSRTLERFLTIAWNSGAQPVVILNKADLAEDPEAIKAEAEFAAPGAEVFITSAETGEGIERLQELTKPGNTAVFIGPSGVGKSALTNALLGNDTLLTGTTREDDKRGRHTTTSAQLVEIPNGGFIVDSPGLREIQLWGDGESVDAVFDEIAEFALKCRFRDCTHEGEPGCAVQQALAEGNLDQARYQNYLQLKREMRYLDTKQNVRARQEEHNRNRKFGKMIRNMKSNKMIY